MKLIAIATILTYLFWFGNCDQGKKADWTRNSYENWKILDDKNESLNITSSNILAFRVDEAKEHLIVMYEITEGVPDGPDQNYVLIQYRKTSYKFAENTSYDNFDVNEAKGMAYFYSAARFPDDKCDLRIYCINYTDTTQKEIKVYNITDMGPKLIAPVFGRLKAIDETNKVVFTAKDTDFMKYICLFTEENTEGNLNAKINCIKLRKAAWSETFIPYGNIVKNTKVLFSKKAHDHRITMQAIDFDNVNEVSFWIDTPEFLGINMIISDGHYYQYGESD